MKVLHEFINLSTKRVATNSNMAFKGFRYVLENVHS